MTSTRQTTFKSLKLVIVGESSCEWKKFSILQWRSHKYKFHIARDTLTGRELLINQTFPVFDNTKTSCEGSKSFEFSCDLPPNIPPSFNEKYGNIRYTIKASLEEENSEATISSDSVSFDVIHSAHPNHSFVFKTVPSLEVKRSFKSCSRNSRSLQIIVGMPNTSFQSGDCVPIAVHVENQSGVEVKEISVSLVKLTTYRSQRTKIAEKTQVEVVLSEFFSRQAIREQDDIEAIVKIPALMPIFSSLIINVAYEFHVCVKMSCSNTFPKIKIPLEVQILAR